MKKDAVCAVVSVSVEKLPYNGIYDNYYCRGQFTALHKGHPNEDDLNAAKKFVAEIVKEYK